MPRNANQSKSSNYSLDFSGAQYISIDTNGSFPFGLMNTGVSSTVSLWAKLDTLSQSSNVVLFEQRNTTPLARYVIWFENTTNTINFYANASKQSQAVNANQWYHIVATLDGANARFYVDGSEVGAALTYTPTNTNQTLELGRQPNNTQLLNGKINEVSIFDYALSPSQVTTLWGGGTSVSNPMALPSTPIAYYPLGTSAYNGEYLAENNAIGDYVFDFSGGTDIISYSNINLTGNRTVSFWVNLNSPLTSAVYLGSGGNDYYPYMTATSVLLRSSTQGSSSITQPSIVTEKWYHYCITGDGTNATLYRDGVLIGTLADKSLIINTIGGTPTGSSDINAKMSNVQIFNTALTGPEVETLYNYGSPIRTLANIPQNSNLKAWYKLDASEVYNSSTTEWSIDNNQNPSAYPSSLDFVSSESDYIQIPYNVSLTPQNENFTISAWINTDNLSGWRPIWCTQNLSSTTPIVALHTFGDKVRATVGGSTNNPSYGGSWALILDSTQSLTTSTWYHIAVSYNMSGNAQIYINGSPDNSGPIENPQTSWNTGDRFIGEGEGYWDGRISNLSIWNTALTSAQVTEIYNNGTPSNLSSHSVTSNLISWWKLNNLTTGIEDSKGSNNGTNNGATEYTGFVNTLVGDSSGMTQANLVQSDLQTVAPYSKYALNFDGTDYVDCGQNTNLDTGDLSASIWINKDSAGIGTQYFFNNNNGSSIAGFTFIIDNTNRLFINRRTRTKKADSGWLNIGFTEDAWHHLCFTYNDTSGAYEVYFNGYSVLTLTASSQANSASQNITIGTNSGLSGLNFNGKLSNASIWNTALTSAQVTEIYNEGLPSNLNSHSAYSNLVSWWQLGENSSYVGGATNPWTFADEKGTNNGLSPNLPETALTNGVGTTANGVSTGMSEGNLVGDAPYSTANAISSGMAVTARGTDVPPTP